MKNLNRSIGLVFIFLFLGSITSCNNGPEQNQKKSKVSDNEVKRVSIAYTNEPINWLMIIAIEQDLLSKEGLDITPKYYPSGKRALIGMFSGEVQFAVTAITPIVFSSFKRQDFSILATIGSTNNHTKIVSRKDRGIQKPEDLKGKRIATQKASSVHFFLHLFLTKHNLLKREVEISFAKIENLPALLAGNKVDAISTREPFFSEAIELLGDIAIVFEEPGLYFKAFNLVAFNSFIKNNPEIIERVVRAMIQAEKFVINHPDQAIKILADKFKLSESRVAEEIRKLDLSVRLDERLLLELEDQAKWVIKNELKEVLKVPNYLNFVAFKVLESVRPESVNIIH